MLKTSFEMQRKRIFFLSLKSLSLATEKSGFMTFGAPVRFKNYLLNIKAEHSLPSFQLFCPLPEVTVASISMGRAA
jgi:hypothetical protein